MPLLIDFDVVVLHHLPSRAHPLLVRMLQDVLAVLRMNCIQDVEEVGPLRFSVVWIVVLKVDIELPIFL